VLEMACVGLPRSLEVSGLVVIRERSVTAVTTDAAINMTPKMENNAMFFLPEDLGLMARVGVGEEAPG